MVIPVKPTWCPHCQHPLCGDDPQPHRHQVTESPPVKPVVTEYQLHRLVCPVCGEGPGQRCPRESQQGDSAPGCRRSRAVYGGVSSLQTHNPERPGGFVWRGAEFGHARQLEQATVQAVAEPVAEARRYVQQQPAAYLDETGWREGPQRAWLWTAVTAGVTVFVVRLSRSSKVAQELLGSAWGWLVTDRWSAYSWYPTWRRQLCWAHLLRDIEAMIARGGQSREIGEALQAQAHQMFHWWHRVRDGTLAHASFGTYMRPIRQEVERLLEAGQTCGVPKTEGVVGTSSAAASLVDVRPA